YARNPGPEEPPVREERAGGDKAGDVGTCPSRDHEVEGPRRQGDGDEERDVDRECGVAGYEEDGGEVRQDSEPRRAVEERVGRRVINVGVRQPCRRGDERVALPGECPDLEPRIERPQHVRCWNARAEGGGERPGEPRDEAEVERGGPGLPGDEPGDVRRRIPRHHAPGTRLSAEVPGCRRTAGTPPPPAAGSRPFEAPKRLCRLASTRQFSSIPSRSAGFVYSPAPPARPGAARRTRPLRSRRAHCSP